MAGKKFVRVERLQSKDGVPTNTYVFIDERGGQTLASGIAAARKADQIEEEIGGADAVARLEEMDDKWRREAQAQVEAEMAALLEKPSPSGGSATAVRDRAPWQAWLKGGDDGSG